MIKFNSILLKSNNNINNNIKLLSNSLILIRNYNNNINNNDINTNIKNQIEIEKNNLLKEKVNEIKSSSYFLYSSLTPDKAINLSLKCLNSNEMVRKFVSINTTKKSNLTLSSYIKSLILPKKYLTNNNFIKQGNVCSYILSNSSSGSTTNNSNEETSLSFSSLLNLNPSIQLIFTVYPSNSLNQNFDRQIVVYSTVKSKREGLFVKHEITYLSIDYINAEGNPLNLLIIGDSSLEFNKKNLFRNYFFHVIKKGSIIQGF